MNPSIKKPVICWWSGGVTSAVACNIAINIWGLDKCKIVMIDTRNEDEDTYRFKKDCEKWYGTPIRTVSNSNYKSIQDVWLKYKKLNTATGAICSSELKRAVRLKFQKENNFSYQVFGFDIREPKRAEAMKLNYPESSPIFPLLMFGYSKKDCIRILEENGIVVPASYRWGYLNNNCFNTMCIQGGIGYWQKVAVDFPPKFDAMADLEHLLTDLRGEPVAMLKDQSNEAKKAVQESGDKTLAFVFLKPHPKYPHIKDLSMMKGRKPEPLVECNGFCGIDDTGENKNSLGDLNLELDFD